MLFAHGWDDVLRSVAWVVDDLVMRRVLKDDGTTFDRWSPSQTLSEEWRLESLYLCYRPALVSSVGHATAMLGSHVDVLDKFPSGPLQPPRHRALKAP